MTGTPDSFDEAPLSSNGQGPGRLVRQARETRGLSIEDLAAQIKLARNTLDAIERDDFAQLNEPVYVRGYYRKLSKVLPVTEAELLSAYERIAGNRTPPPPSKLILAGGPELGSGRGLSPRIAVAIIVLGVLIGALAFWGKNRSTQPEAPEVTPAAVDPAATAVVEPVAATPEPVAPPTAEVPAATNTPAVEPTTPPVAPAEPPAAPAATGPLQLQFGASSWTEIKDATGKVLLSGLVDAGSNQTLDGTPPFVVFLGNAPAVRITYKGQAVDTTPFRRGDNTARVTLP